MDAPQTQPPRLMPFLVLAVSFYVIVGAIAYARSLVLDSLKPKLVITSLKENAEDESRSINSGTPARTNEAQGETVE